MAQTIQIKRGTGSSVPSSLAEGELAINLDSGKFYYGSGSSVLSDFRFDSITAEKYVISSSVTHMTTSFSSGSTAFGDSSDDTHQFTGSIDIAGNSLTMTHATTPTIRLKDTTNNFFVDLKQANNFGIELDGSSVQDFYIATNQWSATTPSTTALYMDGGNGLLSLNGQKVTINVSGDITTEGEVSSSSNIHASLYKVDDENLANMSGGTLQLGTSNGVTQIDLGKSNAAVPVFANGAITCSTDISASGNIYANKFGNNLEIIDNSAATTIAVDSAGGVGNSGLAFAVDGTNKIELNKDTLATQFHGDTTFNGDLTVTAGTSGDATLIIEADTDNDNENDLPRLWFRADAINEGAVQLQNNTLDIINNVSGNGGIRFLTGTTNNTGTTDPSTGATERLNIASAGTVSASGDIAASRYFVDGQNLADMSGGTLQLGTSAGVTQIDLGKGNSAVPVFANGAITCSTDISSSATVQGNTGSFNAMTKLTQVIPYYYYNTSGHGSRKFIPHNSATDTTVSQPYNMILAPFAGKVRRVSINSHAQNPGNLTCSLHIENSPVHNTSLTTIAESKAISGAVQDTSYHFDFTASFSAGNAIYVGVQYDGGTTNTYINGSIAIDFDTTQG